MPLLLSNAEVESLIDMQDALATTEEAMQLIGREGTCNEPRRRMALPESSLQMLAGCMPTRGVFGQRSYSSSRKPGGGKFNRLLLYSTRDHSFLALMDCAYISFLRTGAATAVAAKYLARSDADTLAVIGTGSQAHAQIEAMCASRRIKEIRVYSRDEDRRRRFAAGMDRKLGIRVYAMPNAQKCVEGASLVIAATQAATPVIDGKWVAAGAHVTGMGANAASRRELDDATVLGAAVITTDDVVQARIEAGAFIDLVKAGLLNWDRVHQLSDVVQGKIPGRTSPDQTTLFMSLGIGIEDVALGALVYERAIARNVGRMIEV